MTGYWDGVEGQDVRDWDTPKKRSLPVFILGVTPLGLGVLGTEQKERLLSSWEPDRRSYHGTVVDATASDEPDRYELIVVGASPFTLTNRDARKRQVVVTGGVVTSVTKTDKKGVITTLNNPPMEVDLEPAESITVTYSVGPRVEVFG